MTDDDIVIEVAKLDGWKEAFPRDPALGKDRGGILLPYRYEQVETGKRLMEYPSYLASRDAIIPVIEKQVGLGNRFEYRFIQCLCETMPGMPAGGSATRLFPEIFSLVVRTSARQLCIALLKATGRWRD